jgi:hypothetical protein
LSIFFFFLHQRVLCKYQNSHFVLHMPMSCHLDSNHANKKEFFVINLGVPPLVMYKLKICMFCFQNLVFEITYHKHFLVWRNTIIIARICKTCIYYRYFLRLNIKLCIVSITI